MVSVMRESKKKSAKTRKAVSFAVEKKKKKTRKAEDEASLEINDEFGKLGVSDSDEGNSSDNSSSSSDEE